MGPAKKGRHPRPSQSTLHQFFLSSSTPLPPTTHAPRIKKKLTTIKPVPPSNVEIIEISSSDDEIETVSVTFGRKRQRSQTAGNNSEAEIPQSALRPPAPKRLFSASKSTKSEPTSDMLRFGQPSDLLRDANFASSSFTRSPSQYVESETTVLSFGKPTSLLESAGQIKDSFLPSMTPPSLRCPTPHQSNNPTISKEDVLGEADLVLGEWGTGDDEVSPEVDFDNFENATTGLGLGFPLICPYCSNHFTEAVCRCSRQWLRIAKATTIT